MKPHILFFVIASQVFTMCALGQDRDVKSVFLQDFLGGKEAYETISHPEHVEACLLNSGRNAPRTKPITIDPEIAKSFSAALLDDKSHSRMVTSHCDPDYGMQLEFKRGSDIVKVKFCFECKIIGVTHGKYNTTISIKPEKDKTIEETFDFAKNHFANLAKKLFPDDKTIQGLKEAS
jgi:hypothetical protein